MCRGWIGQKLPGMDSGDKVEMAVALDELLEAREQAAREPLEAQVAALRAALMGAACWCKRPKLTASDTCNRCHVIADTASAAREHDEAIKRAAFEAGRQEVVQSEKHPDCVVILESGWKALGGEIKRLRAENAAGRGPFDPAAKIADQRGSSRRRVESKVPPAQETG
jgi:hypothetical protein